MILRFSLVFSLSLFGLTACSGGGGGPPTDACEAAATETPSATLGMGSTIYAPLSDGDDVDINQGAQGGFHVWGTVRVTGLYPGVRDRRMDPSNPDVVFQVATMDGTIVGDTGSIVRPLKVRSDGQVELVGEIVPLMIGSTDDLAFQTVTLSVSITDFCGTTVMDSRSVRLVPST
ncbi:MAG: hypothetical protein GXP55_10950 [Deltaproteobacteria bacterium]|nr:hypothetical protein [Deltaproteobacteria bacterium]